MDVRQRGSRGETRCSNPCTSNPLKEFPGIMFCDRKWSDRMRMVSGKVLKASTVWVLLFLAGALTAPVGAQPEVGSTVELRISVVNPLDREQRKEVRSNLPAGVSAGDVQDTGGMELRYDLSQDRYYVYGVVDLDPRQRRDFRIVMRDVWRLPEERLTEIQQQTARLEDLLRDTPYGEAASGLAQEIQADLRELRLEQDRHSIAAGARAADHIRAYHLNRVRLADIRNRLGQLENLSLGAGLDPGRLLGTLSHAPRPELEETDRDQEEYGEAVMIITVQNTSQEQSRTVTLRRDLPREVRLPDVLDAGGLEVGIDPARGGLVYVSRDELELEPGETRTFEVRLRDRWDIHGARLAALETAAVRTLERVRGMGEYPSVETFLEDVLAEIETLRAESAPDTVDDHYVAFFRAREERLDELAEKIGRVEATLRPGDREQRLGFDVEPPDVRTTWMIIYIILAFLGVFSLLFFLRWYGREPK